MSSDPNKQIHDLIISKLDKIETQTTLTNGRVTNLEKELIEAKNDIAQALVIISGHSGVIKYYKEESDRAKDLLIENQAKKIERDIAEKEKFNKRVLYGLVIVVLFILGTIGIVREDFIKLLIGL